MDRIARVRSLLFAGVLVGAAVLVVGLLLGDTALAVLGGLLAASDVGFILAFIRRPPG